MEATILRELSILDVRSLIIAYVQKWCHAGAYFNSSVNRCGKYFCARITIFVESVFFES